MFEVNERVEVDSPDLLWYTYSQNNSGGILTGPALYVIAQATDAGSANDLVESTGVGVYFDGCSYGRDCSCCGDRWSEQWSDDEGTPLPEIYGEPVLAADVERFNFRSWVDEEGGKALLVYADGRTELVK